MEKARLSNQELKFDRAANILSKGNSREFRDAITRATTFLNKMNVVQGIPTEASQWDRWNV